MRAAGTKQRARGASVARRHTILDPRPNPDRPVAHSRARLAGLCLDRAARNGSRRGAQRIAPRPLRRRARARGAKPRIERR